ncbi:hypothetical protein ED5_3153 [Enterobacter roggenkampii]|nr:hypothetical protein ED5_3153 [Enterobacter roggenkampii]
MHLNGQAPIFYTHLTAGFQAGLYQGAKSVIIEMIEDIT